MKKSSRLTAEEQFKATQKKTEKALAEKEQALEERTQRTAALRARRLAKEAADKKDALAEAAAKPRKKKSSA